MGMLFLVIAALDFPLLTSRLTGEPLMGCLALPIGFILFNMKYFSRRNQWLALLVLLVALSNSIFLARRSLILTFGLLLLIAIILILRNTKISAWIKALPAGALAICLLIIFSDSFIPKMTERINERLTEDSRSYVVDNFFKDMEKDMLFGKGMNGKYYSPIEETAYVEDGVKFDEIEFRDMIENGYLQSVLSGGIVNVVLFLLTILPAAFLGIVKSNNSFTRACGLTILLFAVDMVAYGLPRLTTQYLVVWISVGVCYTHSLRNLDEEYWHIKFNPTS
jgi:O-antigen ligase